MKMYEDFDYKKAQLELLEEREVGGRALCPRTFMKGCKLCEFIGMPAGTLYRGISLGWHSHPGILFSRDMHFNFLYPDSVREVAARYRAREHIWTLVIFTRKDPRQVYLFKIGWQVFQKLRTLYRSEVWGNFWDINHGYELEITKFVDKNQRFAYDVVPNPKRGPLPDLTVVDKLPDKLTIDVIIEATSNDQKRIFPLMTTGQLEAGSHYIRFLPIVKNDPEVWFLRLYWHNYVTQQELDDVNEGRLNPSVLLFNVTLEQLRGGVGISSEEEEEGVANLPLFQVTEDKPSEVTSVMEEEGEEEDTKVEEVEKPACFGDPGFFDPDDELCSKDCDWFNECKRTIKRSVKRGSKK